MSQTINPVTGQPFSTDQEEHGTDNPISRALEGPKPDHVRSWETNAIVRAMDPQDPLLPEAKPKRVLMPINTMPKFDDARPDPDVLAAMSGSVPTTTATGHGCG